MRSAPRFSPSMGVALAALVISLGGTSYAALKLPRDSVGAKQIREGAVKSSEVKDSSLSGIDILNDSLTGSDVREDALTGDDIKTSTLRKVASAQVAESAGVSTAVQRVTYVKSSGTIAAGSPNGAAVKPGSGAVSARCPSGTSVISGGAHVEDDEHQIVNDSHPDGTTGWTTMIFNFDLAAHTATAWAICIPVVEAR